MSETLLEELKRYVDWSLADEAALRALHPRAFPELPRIANVFYERILAHSGARRSLDGTSAQLDRLKGTLVAWMDSLLSGPWDEAYYERRARIGRTHVRIALPQHYMLGAMNVVRRELDAVIDEKSPATAAATRRAVGKILDLDLAIMLHTYREDLLAQQARVERLSTFGQLVGSIAHELRNPLSVIETSLFILRSRIGEDERIHKHGIRLTVLGQRELLPEKVQAAIKYAEEKSASYSNYFYNIAIAYGSRQEIIQAIKGIAQEVKDGKLRVDQINEDVVNHFLYTADFPDPDLVLRTSGEERVSNFLLWQLAYSELYFTDVYWPGFRKVDFLRAIRSYQLRQRRFGK